MSHQTRFHRREVFRVPLPRHAYRIVRLFQVKQALRALEALYRR